MHELFARCASGFEDVLADELRSLGAMRVRPLKGGVSFAGSTLDAYRACLWSRVATRIQLVFARVPAVDAQALYAGVRSFAWERAIAPGSTMSVRVHGQNNALRNTQFTALKVKDAVCDRLREMRGSRPNVDAHDPGFAIDVSLHRDKATLYLNLSGPSLHRRGYREDGVQTQAPLKETLAGGMLLAAGWPAAAKQGAGLLDPMCGSGTLAIEAALMALDIAPGLLRPRWGFEGWLDHDAAAWEGLRNEALGSRKEAPPALRIIAADIDARALSIARSNAERAGVGAHIEFHQADCAEASAYLGAPGSLTASGLLVSNPPYGQRMGDADAPAQARAALARALEAVPAGWDACIITPDSGIDTAFGAVPDRVISCFNGPLESAVRIYRALPAARTKLALVSLAGIEHEIAVAEPNSDQFASRLRKSARERAKWARRQGVSCYRVYDADLPDYAFAIDLYEGAGRFAGQRFVHFEEYQPPASVDAARAQRRRSDAQAIIPVVLDIKPGNAFGKVRQHAKGGSQYREAQGDPFAIRVQEGGYLFEVDLNARLDTGLFLDHRETRKLVGEMSQGKRFLNLFAYTGTASVYAAGGGASATTTVDLSATYLEWAKRNMAANGFEGPAHNFERADVLAWLERAASQGATFDLVFCDPPTFSNSKAMDAASFEVQRDHVELLQAVGKVLAPGGAIVFSCNRRSFKLDDEAVRAAGLIARDITADTIPHDFARTPRVHQCFVVKAM